MAKGKDKAKKDEKKKPQKSLKEKRKEKKEKKAAEQSYLTGGSQFIESLSFMDIKQFFPHSEILGSNL